MVIGGPDDGVITPWQSRYILYNQHHVNNIIIAVYRVKIIPYDNEHNIFTVILHFTMRVLLCRISGSKR